MTQKEFAELTGIKQSTISEWKKNHTNPTSDKIMSICNVLDVSPEWLLSKVGGIQTSLAESNDKVNLSDPHSWKGKYVGVVVGDEEYESNSGTVYTRPYVNYICSTGRIRKGENQPGGYKIPKLKTLAPSAPKPLSPADVPDSFSAAEDDIPF